MSVKDDSLVMYRMGFEDGHKQGYIEGKNEGEESSYRLFVSKGENKLYVGHRCENRYYAEVIIYPGNSVCLAYGPSRFLPWGETVNGVTYPEAPTEITIEEFLEYILGIRKGIE